MSSRFVTRGIVASKKLSLLRGLSSQKVVATQRFLQTVQTTQGFRTHPAVTVQWVDGLGYDLQSRGSIPADSTVLEVPKETWWPVSAEGAMEAILKEHSQLAQGIITTVHQMFPPKAPDSTKITMIRSCCLAFGLLKKFMDKDSFASTVAFSSYPWDTSVQPHPLLMDKTMYLEPFLRNTPLLDAITKRQSFYTVFITRLLQHNDDILPYLLHHQFMEPSREGLDPVRQFLWAIGVILSRGLSSDTSPLSLVPYLDFANHSSSPETGENCRHSYDADAGTFKLTSIREIHTNESLRINYGTARSTESFMLLYGFPGCDIVDDKVTATTPMINRNDELQVSLPINKSKSVVIPQAQLQSVMADIPVLLSSSTPTEEDEGVDQHVHVALQQVGCRVTPSAVQLSLPLHTMVSAQNCAHDLATRIALLDTLLRYQRAAHVLSTTLPDPAVLASPLSSSEIESMKHLLDQMLKTFSDNMHGHGTEHKISSASLALWHRSCKMYLAPQVLALQSLSSELRQYSSV